MLVKMLAKTPPSMDPADPNAEVWEIEIPDGWRRVWTGSFMPGDKYLHCTMSSNGNPVWIEIDVDALPPVPEPYSSAKWWALVIRRGTDTPEKNCQRCDCNYAPIGFKYCSACDDILKIKRRKARA